MTCDPLGSIPASDFPRLIAEVFTLLRDALDGPSEWMADRLITTSDELCAAVVATAEYADCDVTGIPFWRDAHGRVIGSRTGTRAIHLQWIASDALDINDPLAYATVVARLRAALTQACRTPAVAAALAAEVEDAQLASLADDFAELREGLRA
ncbi:hypothetical protein [Gordonia polyisoprenivorans]|uniref:hypothetical protein n=1 Tax=Gordonia polyisoprenivorans TaxID=84595 RepID=UPI00037765FA|nr:hypothetical protein [Gordonia polyisoprenivorans]